MAKETPDKSKPSETPDKEGPTKKENEASLHFFDLPSANSPELPTEEEFDEIIKNGLPPESDSATSTTKFNKPAKSPWVIVAAVAALLVLVGAIWGASTFIAHQKEEQALIAKEEAAKEESEEQEELLKAAPNPLAMLAGKTAPEVTEGELTSTVSTEESKNGIITVTDGTSLYLNDGSLSAPVNTCATNLPTDFCLSARAKYKNENFEIFLVKDLANNRLAEAPTNFKEIENKENLILATMTIDINNENIPVAALSQEGGTGFLYFFSPTTPLETIEEIIANTSLLKN